MSEERFIKIESKQVEHDKVLDKYTYLIERIEESLEKMGDTLKNGIEKMDKKFDDLHGKWVESNSMLTSYSDMKTMFRETTDKLQAEISKAHTDIEEIQIWQAEQKGRGKVTLLLWGLASTIFGGFVTAIMVALVLGK